nr:uncharacterized protein K02A2.6-like [Zootoca vivipara]
MGGIAPRITRESGRADFPKGLAGFLCRRDSKVEWDLGRHSIQHVLTAPFHPTSNGQAERMVRSAKEALARLNQGDWHERVTEYLLVQHITPHAATGRSPAELLMGRRLRSPLDRLHPDFGVAKPPGCANAPQSFIPGDWVFARNFVGDIPWVPATVVGVTGPRSYQVALEDGHLWRRHIDQLRRRVGNLDTATVPPTAPPAPEQALTEGEARSTPPSQAADVDPRQATSEVQQGPQRLEPLLCLTIHRVRTWRFLRQSRRQETWTHHQHRWRHRLSRNRPTPWTLVLALGVPPGSPSGHPTYGTMSVTALETLHY